MRIKQVMIARIALGLTTAVASLDSRLCRRFRYHSSKTSVKSTSLRWFRLAVAFILVCIPGVAASQSPPSSDADRLHAANWARVAEIDRLWAAYSSREKTLLEQVLNYQTTGQLEGTVVEGEFEGVPTRQVNFWISGHGGKHRCELTSFDYMTAGQEVVSIGYEGPFTDELVVQGLMDFYNAIKKSPRAPSGLAAAQLGIIGMTMQFLGVNPRDNRRAMPDNQVVDIRQFNQTAFRISSRVVDLPLSGSFTLWTAGDGRLVVEGMPEDVVLEKERLVNAWTLAFRECPGRRSAF